MSYTHADLIAAIDKAMKCPIEDCSDRECMAMRAHLDTLRAVLDLHAPSPDVGQGWVDDSYGGIDPCCTSCGTPDEYAIPWPCFTVQVVADALRKMGAL